MDRPQFANGQPPRPAHIASHVYTIAAPWGGRIAANRPRCPTSREMTCAAGSIRTLSVVRDPETIDSELRLIAAVRRSIREHVIEP